MRAAASRSISRRRFLSGQELTKQLEMSLGATLENQPASRRAASDRRRRGPSFAGSTATACRSCKTDSAWATCPVSRVTMASRSIPAAATRIDVVRGPATLLYGTNAIGGLVNVITEDIPTRPLEGSSGNVTFDVGSAAKEAAARSRHPRRQRPFRAARWRRRPPIG